MSAAEGANFPTMIIPRGTEIRINAQGQLSIRTPGNLVIQNSGTYSELESTNGSIRIEENVQVEAVSVRAAQACFIQGTLTAWRVKARKIALENNARANIMVQESEQLELSKSSRLVGNFADEKEIYLLLGKFNSQLKALPQTLDVSSPQPAISAGTGSPLPHAGEDPLRTARNLLEEELARAEIDYESAEILREIVFALRENDAQRIAAVYSNAFDELRNPTERTRRAFELIDGWAKRR